MYNRPNLEIAGILLSLALVIPNIHAAAPVAVTYTTNRLLIPFFAEGDNGNCRTACLGFTTAFIGSFNDLATVSNQWVNYTNLALTAASNPAQSFAISNDRLNATLNAVATNGIEFQVFSRTTFTSEMPSITTFTPGMHVQTTLYPPEVDVTVGNLKTVIQRSSYVTTTAAFISCQAPCVFGSSANRTVVVKTTTTMPQIIDILTQLPTSIIPMASPDYSGYIGLLLLPLILILFLKRRGQPENVRSQ